MKKTKSKKTIKLTVRSSIRAGKIISDRRLKTNIRPLADAL